MGIFRRLTRHERYQIQALIDSGHSQRFVARALSRNVSTISRELSLGRRNRRYSAEAADVESQHRIRAEHPGMRRIRGSREEYIREALEKDWSPEQISKMGRAKVSTATIYRYLDRDKIAGGRLWKHLRVLRKQRKDKNSKGRKPREYMPGRVSIRERPEIVQRRVRVGDFERDTVLGCRAGAVLLTIVDRTSRLTKIAWLPKNTSDAVHRATVKLLSNEIVHTITNDNGTEFARHKETASELKTKIYFADAWSAGQRGTNENTNGLLRQYYPKKKPIPYQSPEQIALIEAKLNDRPRKCLGFKTPMHIHTKLKRQVLR